MINKLRKIIEHDIFDYQILVEALKEYTNPRDKISRLIKSGDIISVRKGLYVFEAHLRNAPLQKEILAGMIYGPSYISLDFALSHHGLIPEKANSITSVTIGRSRIFDTPVGRYTYKMIPQHAYAKGIDLVETKSGAYQIATPEKAIVDKLALERNISINGKKSMLAYLIDNLRIDKEFLERMNINDIESYITAYDMKKLAALLSAIKEIQCE